jgi:enoyl-CoA hydratase
LLTAIRWLDKPVIAAVNGYCLGGGCELVYACTLAYAAAGARFGQSEVSLGLLPLLGGSQHLPRRVGMKKALELLLLGDMIDAAEALRLGLINGVVAPEDLMPTVRGVAGRLGAKAPLAVRLLLECAQQAGDVTLEQGMDLEASAFAQLCGTADLIEGLTAFLEKRAPQFQGR